MALTKITPQMFDTSAAGHDFNIDNGTFVVDASANRVGIGTSSPSEKLDVDGIIQINRTGDHPAIRFLEGGTTRGYMGSADWAVNGGATADFGISSGASGSLLLGTNAGTARMRILSNGNVGIGISPNASADLHVADTSDARIWLEATSGDTMELYAGTNVSLFNRSNNALTFGTNNTERMRINARGALVFNPSSGTEVNNSIVAHTNNYMYMFGNTDGLILQNNIVGDARILIDDANTMRFQTSSVERMRIDSSGNVGIGRTPRVMLDVAGEAAIAYAATYGLRFYNQDQNNWSSIGNNIATGSSAANLVFKDSTGEVMRLSSGNVGIGMSPAKLLDLQATDNLALRFYNGTSFKGGIEISTTAGDMIAGSAVNDLAIRSQTNILFATGGNTERMRINSDGHVTAPYNPAFRAYLSTEQTSNGVVSSGWSDSGLTLGRSYDRDGDFNTSNGRFTAPVDGVYLFSIMWDSNASQAGFDLVVNGATGYNVRWEPTGRTDDAWESKHYSAHVKLDKDDYVQIVIRHASGSYPVHMGGGYWGHFAGCLIS